MNPRVCGAVLALFVLVSAQAAGEDEVNPDWAESLRLVFFGGPPPTNIEVQINGEFVASIEESVPLTLEIADLLQPGANELALRFTPPEEPRNGRDLRISVAAIEAVSTHQSEVQRPLTEVRVPAELRLDAECEEVRRFWVDPPESPATDLKKRFWLFVSGPPVRHCVTVVVNGSPVADVSSGTHIIEITKYLVKGKNEVVFEGRVTCLREKTSRDDPLQFAIGPAKVDVEVVRMTQTPVAVFEINQRRKPEPFTKIMKFRAW